MSTTRRTFLGAGLRALSAASLGVTARSVLGSDKEQVSATELASGVTLLAGAGCNVIAVHGPEGSLLVDGGYAAHSKALLRAVAHSTTDRHQHADQYALAPRTNGIE